MSPETLFENILTIPNVKGFAFVSSEDGSIMKRGGVTPGNIDEIVAFIGSAAGIISESCGVKEIKSIKVIGVYRVVIIPHHDNYLGFVLRKDEKDIEKNIIKMLSEEEAKSDIIVNKLLKTKSSQLNMLINEFTKDSDRLMWKDYISKGLAALSKGSKLENYISLEDLEFKVSSVKGLTREEVNKFIKMLLDFIVKKAVLEFGSNDAKKRVHEVIKRMGKNK